ncbi:hypothetical protein KP77_34360 [Jeotgalibacillus alimentarius]|uniref:Uncharacterized protein n=1 Tax=Jeotgalibacillus alimentarius TaxID=135826 RepID=A0A0C2VE21_9BACL|nr:DUF3185 family protein [Jeotgalibacillus alimentarius]KIL42806.1 hypothetical protein KP77_34360 [Jeotgalibacillus alimentarius]
MKNLRWISMITFLLGLVFITYGWTQTWAFSASSSDFERILMERTVRSYVFVVGGVILVIVGVSINMVKDNMLHIDKKDHDRL